MNVKNKLGALALGCAVIGLAAFGYTHSTEAKESYSTEAVLISLWDEYEGEIQSTQAPSENSSIINVSVYDEKNINDVENYLESNLSEKDLEHYKLNIYQNPDG